MKIILSIYLGITTIYFLYLLALCLIFFVRNQAKNIGKIIYKFGHIENKLISLLTWMTFIILMNRITNFKNDYKYYLSNNSEETTEIILAFIFAMVVFIIIGVFFIL